VTTGKLTLPRVGGLVTKHGLLICGAVVMMLPFVWMVLASLKDFSQIFDIPPKWLPNPVEWDNYPRAWTALPFAQAYLNSVVIAVSVVAIQLVTCSMAGYAFARIRFKFRGPLFVLFLATMMVPTQLTIIPLYLIMKQIGWLDTHWSLIVPAGFCNVFGVFLMRQFIRGIPAELEEAAILDGASRWRIFWQIIMPLLRAPLAALGIFTFMAQWNNFFMPLIFLNSPEKFTVPVLINQFRGLYGTDFSLLLAASSLAVIPVIVVFVIAQRRIVEGVALTGIRR
jgi:multiple sugar transport system permease protein